MRIAALETRHFRVAPATPWTDALNVVEHLDYLFARLVTDDGSEGLGLSYTVGAGGSAVKAILDEAASLVGGIDARRMELVETTLTSRFARLGRSGVVSLALAAVDIALWDLRARAAGVPLHVLFGGTRGSIDAYASGIDLGLEPDDLVADVCDRISRGYRAVKIKVGRKSPSDDVARVGAVRAAIGPEPRLMLDANQAWRIDQALPALAALERFNPAWIEEPLVASDVEGHAQLRRASRIPIAVGESLFTPQEFLAYLRAGAVDVLQPDVVRVGGYSGWLRVAHLAEAWGLPVAAHFQLELSSHAMCGVANGLVLEDVAGGSLSELGLLRSPITVNDAGVCVPPGGPGHGIEPDWDALAAHEA